MLAIDQDETFDIPLNARRNLLARVIEGPCHQERFQPCSQCCVSVSRGLREGTYPRQPQP